VCVCMYVAVAVAVIVVCLDLLAGKLGSDRELRH